MSLQSLQIKTTLPTSIPSTLGGALQNQKLFKCHYLHQVNHCSLMHHLSTTRLVNSKKLLMLKTPVMLEKIVLFTVWLKHVFCA